MRKHRSAMGLDRSLHAVLAVSILLTAACTAARLRPEDPGAPQILERDEARESGATSIWNGVYTEAQARRGEATYVAECARCHRTDLRGEEMAPGLKGVAFSFRWRDQSVNEIFSSVRSTMPTEAPGSLSEQAYIDLVAYLLSANEYPSGDAELEPDEAALSEIAIERSREK